MGDEQTVDAVCVAFPDGTIKWCELDKDDPAAEPRRLLEAWKASLTAEQRERYETNNVMGGFVWLHMMRSDFNRAKGGVA